MKGKTVLVTGSTGGIGKETARGLARRGARVVLVGRDPARGRAAAAEIARDTGNEHVEAAAADLTTREGVRALASWVRDRHDRLDALINNMGATTPARTLTADGIETMFAAHVLTPFTLTRLLRPVLGARARVVNITGGIPGGPIDPGNLQGERRFLGWTFSQYNHTKTMLMAMSRRMAGELAPDGVAVNVAYPGHGYTPMNRAMRVRAFPYAYRPVAPVVKLIAPVLLADLTKATRSSLYLACSPDVAEVTGAYFDQHCRRRPWPPSVLDPVAGDRVWELCEKLSAA
ncbi:MAG: SDR family NAD(P)-dependent oxidoreductase [Nonomuraea sp.]|nr:SDR family NAD(P)-dependent oxidoreductase [Nonomuraea sp.]